MSGVSRRRLAVPPGGFQNVAVLRLSSLGDVVIALPVVHALARAWPEAAITFWTKEEYQDVVRFDPAVAHVRALDRDARRIEDLVSMSAELEDTDLILDLHGNARTRLLSFRQKAPVLRAPSYRLARERWVRARWSRPRPVPPAAERYARTLEPLGLEAADPTFHAGELAEAWAQRAVAEWALDRAPLAMCPAARHFTKRWPEDHWVALDERLAGDGWPRVYFSLEAERVALPALAERVERDPRARWCTESLPRMAALMSRCAAAVTVDSGLMHVAAARGLRVVAMFGSTAPELGFAPLGEGHVVLCRHEPCQPCTLHGRPACPRKHFRCMTALEPDAVATAIASLARAPLVGDAGPTL